MKRKKSKEPEMYPNVNKCAASEARIPHVLVAGGVVALTEEPCTPLSEIARKIKDDPKLGVEAAKKAGILTDKGELEESYT